MTPTEPATASSPATVPLTKRQINVAVGAVLTGMVLGALDSTIVNTALLTIVDDIGGLESYTWVATSYLLTSTPAMALSGKLSDIFGRLRLFQIGIGLFVLGSIISGFAQTMPQLVAARAVQGVGGGITSAMVFAVVADLVSPRDRGRYTGPITSIWAAASLIGPVLGGLFVDHLSWRWIFWINVPIGLASVIVATRVLSRIDFKSVPRRIDYQGAALLVAAVTCFVLAIGWAVGEYGWASATTTGLLALSLLLCSSLIWWETRVEDPFVPLRLFSIPTFRLCVLMAGPASVGMFAVNSFLPLFFQAVGGMSPTMSGLLLAPIMAGLVIGSIVSGRAISTTGNYRSWMVLGSTLSTLGIAALISIDDTPIAVTITVVGMLVVGLGIGMSNPTSTIAVQNVVEPQDMGTGTSMMLFFRTLSSVIGLASFGSIFGARISDRLAPELIRSPRSIRDLAEPARGEALDVLTEAIRLIFIVSLPVLVIGLLAARAITNVPLRSDTTATTNRVGANNTPAPTMGH